MTKIRPRSLTAASVIVLITISCSALQAQQAYTLDDLVKRALSQSGLIKAQTEETESIRWEQKQALAWKNPTAAFATGYKTADGKSGPSYEASISIPFLFPGKKGTIKENYSLKEGIAGLDLEETKLTVGYEVLRLAYAFMITGESVKHLKERVTRFSLMHLYMKSRPFPSPKSRMEKNIVHARLLRLQKDLMELVTRHEVIWAKLNFYTGYDGKIAVSLPWFHRGADISKDYLLNEAKNRNIAVKRFLLQSEIALSDKKIAEKEAFPDFDLGAFYSGDPGVTNESIYRIGVSFKLPLFNLNKNSVKSLDAKAASGKSKYEHRVKSIASEIDVLYAEYLAARKNLTIMPLSLLEAAHAQMNDADAEFKRGTIDLVTYLEMENQIHEIHMDVFAAQMDYLLKYADLMERTGVFEFKGEE